MASSFFPGFLVAFREALEAALVVAIVVSYLKRSGRQRANRYLYLGATAAVAASVIVGLAIWAVFGELEGSSAEIFEGAASLTAAVVLTYMIVWMTGRSRTLRAELEEKADIAVTRGQMLSIVGLSFVAVLREGIETVLFMTTLATADWVGALAGAVLASVTVIGLAVVLMKGIYRLDITRFFQVTGIVLIVFAAGLVSYGVHELMEAGESFGIGFGFLGEHAFDVNPPMNPDGTYALLHEKSAMGSVLAALVGYDGDPEWLRVLAYVGYWAALGAYFILTRRGGTRS